MTAFREGDRVNIELVSPDRDRPEYKYVVFSPYLGKMFQLSDNELASALTRAPSPQGVAPAPVVASSGGGAKSGLEAIVTPSDPGTKYLPIKPTKKKSGYSGLRILLVFGAAAVIIILVVVLAMKVTQGPPDAAAATKKMFLLGEKGDWAGIQAMIDPDAHATDHDPTYPLKFNLIDHPMSATYYSSRYGTNEVRTGFTSIYKFSQQVTGDTAQVVVTTDASHIVNSPVRKTGDVTIATLWLVHKSGKWYITKAEIGDF